MYYLHSQRYSIDTIKEKKSFMLNYISPLGRQRLSLEISAILVKKIKDPVYAGIIPSVLTITLFIEALLATCPTSIFQDSPQPDGKHIPSCFWLAG